MLAEDLEEMSWTESLGRGVASAPGQSTKAFSGDLAGQAKGGSKGRHGSP